jgi:HK97 family phage major capsid protein
VDIKVLREEFASLHAQAGQVLTTAAEAKRELTPEEKEANTKRFARMDSIQAQVNDAKKLAEYSLINGTAELPAQPSGKQEYEAERTGKVTFDKDAFRAAVNHFARTGDMSKVATFAITTGTASGAYLPKEVVEPVTVRRLPNAIRQLIGFYGYQPISRTLTESISLPINDDTGNSGQAQSQSATTGTSVDPDASGSLLLNPTLYSSKQQWLANTTVNAIDFDVFGYVLPMLQRRLDKSQESAWVTSLKTSGVVGKTTASPTTFTYTEWIAFEHSLPAAYRTDAGVLIADSAYQILRGLVDSNNRPILDLDPTNSFMATVHGKPVIVSDYLDAVAATKVVAAFCSADALKVFDAGLKRIARYVLQPSFPDQTGFELFANGDFGFVSGGVRTLVTHA